MKTRYWIYSILGWYIYSKTILPFLMALPSSIPYAFKWFMNSVIVFFFLLVVVFWVLSKLSQFLTWFFDTSDAKSFLGQESEDKNQQDE